MFIVIVQCNEGKPLSTKISNLIMENDDHNPHREDHNPHFKDHNPYHEDHNPHLKEHNPADLPIPWETFSNIVKRLPRLSLQYCNVLLLMRMMMVAVVMMMMEHTSYL